MSSRNPVVPKTIPPVEEKSEQFLPVKGIDPEHLLQAFKNSLEHSSDTSHGVTGLTFSNYTVTVHKRKGLCWHIKCKFKVLERTDSSSQPTRSSTLRCRIRQRRP
jgi:hypothetical protein